MAVDAGGRGSDAVPGRTVPPVAVWALSFGCMVGWGAFVMPSTTFLPAAGPLGVAIAFAIGMCAMLVLTATYGYMERVSTGGGTYSYARDTFGPNHAFVCSWCLVLAYSAATVSNATSLALVVRSMWGSVLQVGLHYTIAGYDIYLGEVLLGVAAIVVGGLICLRDIRLSALIETLLVVGMSAGVLGIIMLMVASPEVGLASIEPPLKPDIPPVRGVLVVLATVPWAYVGFESVTQISHECAFPRSWFAPLMVSAVLCGTVMYLALSTVTAAVPPEGYADWVAYLADLPNLTGLDALPTFRAGYELAGAAGLALFGATAFCAVLSGIVGFYVAATRLIWSMAYDGALPRWFAQLDERTQAPIWATLTVMTLLLFVPFLGRKVIDWITDLMSLGALIAYAYTSLAAYRHARERGKTLMVAAGCLGLLLSCGCIVLLLAPLPGLDVSLSKESYVILFAWVALGVNFYTPTVMRQPRDA